VIYMYISLVNVFGFAPCANFFLLRIVFRQWGETGYFRLARNSTNEFGMCAILKMSSFPVVE
jgi:hypothetical protein